jgi:hypothetical protein
MIGAKSSGEKRRRVAVKNLNYGRNEVGEC